MDRGSSERSWHGPALTIKGSSSVTSSCRSAAASRAAFQIVSEAEGRLLKHKLGLGVGDSSDSNHDLGTCLSIRREGPDVSYIISQTANVIMADANLESEMVPKAHEITTWFPASYGGTGSPSTVGPKHVYRESKGSWAT